MTDFEMVLRGLLREDYSVSPLPPYTYEAAAFDIRMLENYVATISLNKNETITLHDSSMVPRHRTFRVDEVEWMDVIRGL